MRRSRKDVAKAVGHERRAARRLAADDERWQAVVRRDTSADGAFVYSVKTTGVYCRPSCASRLPRRENVRFYATPQEAERAGFRACKRCRPNADSGASGHAAAVAKACRLIEAGEATSLQAIAKSVGLSPSHFQRVFNVLTGVTPKAYAAAHRAARFKKAMTNNGTVRRRNLRCGVQVEWTLLCCRAKDAGNEANRVSRRRPGSGRPLRRRRMFARRDSCCGHECRHLRDHAG